MKIDVTQKIRDLDDNVIPHYVLCDGCRQRGVETILEENELTLRKVIVRAATDLPQEQVGMGQMRPKQIPGEEKLERFDLALRVKKCDGQIDLTTDEISKIKGWIDELYASPIVVARAWAMLEGEE
jgi:H2-forming N5,N10-methylenetetrahydromethanopterin dehydrogenase-like enzyme